ncbi:MAG: hypothetical protein CVV06_14745 [Gammaproteobacteria bacterium HGW-Gammaproteobacteria-10]|nr:MAG: hypothetical protein CVV06_14745 [Gammaproteobacteria bacterium HGW-Gammaproteobacteria-10]
MFRSFDCIAHDTYVDAIVCAAVKNPALAAAGLSDTEQAAAKDLVVNNFPILRRVRLLDWQMSAAGKPPSSLHGRIHGVLPSELPNPQQSL